MYEPTHSAASQVELTIDVIVPTYNREKYILECIESIYHQTMPPRHVIISDDGSSDRTLEIADSLRKKYDGLKIIFGKHRGVSAARNVAMAESDADLIAFIDSDDAWVEDKLERQVALFSDGRPEVGLVYSGFRRIDRDGVVLDLPDIVPNKRGPLFDEMFHRFHGIAPSTMVVRRELIQSIGGFDESLIQGEDRDFCLKLARICEFDCISDPLVRFRIHDGSAYESAMKDNREFVLFQRLQVWNRWDDEAGDAVLTRFRQEAADTTSVWDFLRPSGLFHRLRTSELSLARRLFPTRWAYVAMRSRLASRFGSLWRGLLRRVRFDLVKDFVAQRFVARNRLLLRLAHSMGMLRNIRVQRSDRTE